MPSLSCTCGRRIEYGSIPCPDEWLFISDTDYDGFSGLVDADVIYKSMRSFLKCTCCGSLWVFWDGYRRQAQQFVPTHLNDSDNSASQ